MTAAERTTDDTIDNDVETREKKKTPQQRLAEINSEYVNLIDMLPLVWWNNEQRTKLRDGGGVLNK